ncbi:MAG TPA: UDP-N-acetylglucosamine 2-epimerase (non-hydrolyzing), partial [Chloroflexota bacterium]|nr:UDP-N-acetylglucosamine 2-epimerase (non-hydrolyzing) [Chloroflexota bacterium]
MKKSSNEMAERLRVLTLFGTRPEAIKLAPVIRCLQGADWVESTIVVTGQHRELLEQVLRVFDVTPDADLDLMRPGQPLTDLAGRALVAVGEILRRYQPDLLLVQGDTVSVLVGALAAFYERVAIGHVEAGLRSFNRNDPFPEEINRRLVSVVAELHFAPTARARANLLAEGVPSDRIEVTGNTVVDALLSVRNGPVPAEFGAPTSIDIDIRRRTILVTLHRRESWGAPMSAICSSLRVALDRFPDTDLLIPMHPNPIVRQVVTFALGDHPRAHLVEPLDYVSMIRAMARCHLIVTDSGGIQEEAPALGKPVLVVRETTERPEAIEAGTARLVGTNGRAVLAALTDLLGN